MTRHLPQLFIALLLGALSWTPAQASAALDCAGYGLLPTDPCINISFDGLDIQGSSVLPLGQGTGEPGVGNNNVIDPTYADVMTHVTVTGSGSGFVVVTGADTATAFIGMSFNLLLEDIDPVYGFADATNTISLDFNMAYQLDATLTPDGFSSTSLSLLGGPIELPLGFDVNGNNELDSLFVSGISLDSLSVMDVVLITFPSPTDYGSVSFSFGSATGSFDGKVADILTDPPFSVGLSSSAVAVPAPASLWLLTLGGLIGAMGRRFKQA